MARRVERRERRLRFLSMHEGMPMKSVLDVADDHTKGVIEQDEVNYTIQVVFFELKEGMDTTGDGVADSITLDTTGDGKADTVGRAVDTSGDGNVDAVGVDTTGDGQIDTWINLTLGTAKSGDFQVKLRKTGRNALQLSVPTRDLLSLDMLIDAVESWGDEQVAKQGRSHAIHTLAWPRRGDASPPRTVAHMLRTCVRAAAADAQSSVTDADFEVTSVRIGSTSGVRSKLAVDTTGDGKLDSEAESWMMPTTLKLSDALYLASDKITVTALNKYVVGAPAHSHRLHEPTAGGAGCCAIS